MSPSPRRPPLKLGLDSGDLNTQQIHTSHPSAVSLTTSAAGTPKPAVSVDMIMKGRVNRSSPFIENKRLLRGSPRVVPASLVRNAAANTTAASPRLHSGSTPRLQVVNSKSGRVPLARDQPPRDPKQYVHMRTTPQADTRRITPQAETRRITTPKASSRSAKMSPRYLSDPNLSDTKTRSTSENELLSGAFNRLSIQSTSTLSPSQFNSQPHSPGLQSKSQPNSQALSPGVQSNSQPNSQPHSPAVQSNSRPTSPGNAGRILQNASPAVSNPSTAVHTPASPGRPLSVRGTPQVVSSSFLNSVLSPRGGAFFPNSNHSSVHPSPRNSRERNLFLASAAPSPALISRPLGVTDVKECLTP
eukprot:g24278.t1